MNKHPIILHYTRSKKFIHILDVLLLILITMLTTNLAKLKAYS